MGLYLCYSKQKSKNEIAFPRFKYFWSVSSCNVLEKQWSSGNDCSLSMWLLFCLRLNLLSLFSYVRFNYRSTHHLTTNGFFEFLNWFDERAWYPLGRIVGGTVSFPQNVGACLSFKCRLLFSWVLLELMDRHVHSFTCVYILYIYKYVLRRGGVQKRGCSAKKKLDTGK